MIFRVIFLGTPHRGSDTTIWATILDKIAIAGLHATNSIIIQELKSNSPTLSRISRQFARTLADKELKVISYIEERPTPGAGFVSTL